MTSGIRAIQVWGLVAFLAVSAARPQPARAVELNAGASIGFQAPSSGFAAGTSLFTSLFGQAGLGRGFAVGLGWVGGRSLADPLGRPESMTAGDWTLTGFEVQVSYERPLERVTPYAAVGVGRFRIKPRTMDEDSRVTAALLVGFKAFLSKTFFGLFELRYSFLSFRPEGERLDLSGFRISLGCGIALDI